MVYVYASALFTYVCTTYVFLVGFVVIVVISLTLGMLRYRCGYT
jgi:hypothetical protein